jgi:hypothetical protein
MPNYISRVAGKPTAVAGYADKSGEPGASTTGEKKPAGSVGDRRKEASRERQRPEKCAQYQKKGVRNLLQKVA